MPSHPTGTVTFLFTDIEGSTKLAQKLADEWPMLRAQHDAILQAAITAHKGYIFLIIGDEFDVAFETAQDALNAALTAQRAFSSLGWEEKGPLRVRMGLHTGQATARAQQYEGHITLAHTKRLMSAAHGGQIVLSESTQALLRDWLPMGITLRDLGEHHLKDFEQGEHIFQVVSDGLPADFPPLKSLDRPKNNLPAQLTSFIGRSKEIGEVKQLLSKERLVTLTGPGGSGKTRLALQVASDMIERFPDGVFFVGLAQITDPKLVMSTIAQSISIREAPGRSLLDSLKDYLEIKSLLLLLDNFEQVILAAPQVAELLVKCRELKILATSREGLRVSGEQEYPVLPLAFPNLDHLPPIESLSQYAAIELFIQRSRAVKPDFKITDDTAQAVAEICYRLEGMPLAIELAAARIKLLPPSAMLSRLEHRLDFLTGGGRNLPERQQTLRNAIAWSYDLLNQNEQALFRRLSIFGGGCTLDAADSVAGGAPIQEPVLDLLGSLVDKSLLRVTESSNNETRFMMLEALREFGLEQLEASGEKGTIQRRYANFYLAIAEQAEARLEGAEQIEWMDRMEREVDNLRAVLEWSKSASEPGDACLRLAGMLGIFWEARGYFSEGREQMSTILLMEAAQGRTAARARILARTAELAYRQSDYPATIALAGESLAIYREVGDKQGISETLLKIGNAATEKGDYATASDLYEESLAIWHELADKPGTARALISLGWLALRVGNYLLAKERLQEALAISRDLGDNSRIGMELAGLGEVALRQGDYAQATRLLNESLDRRRQVGNKWGVSVALGTLGWVAMREGDWNRAVARLGESLEIRREIGDKGGCAWCLERLAGVALARGQLEKAVRLFGAGAALRASISSVIDPTDQAEYDRNIKGLKAEFGNERFTAIWAEGEALELEQAIYYALEG